MIMAYCKDEIPGWNAYVDFLSAKGKRFFVTERIRKKFTLYLDLPPVFHLFKYPEFDRADYFAEKAYPLLIETFNATDAVLSSDLTTDLLWLLECGNCMLWCSDIPDDFFHGLYTMYAITANEDMINRFIRKKEDRMKFEMVTRNSILEHLTEIRFVNQNGTLEDFYTYNVP